MSDDLITPNEDPRRFKTGEKVRIFLGYSTCTEIFIRGGVVLGHKKNRVWANSETCGDKGDALVLLVDKTGWLARDNPRKIAIFNRSSGYWVTGQIDTEDCKPYRGSYFYDRICGAERI